MNSSDAPPPVDTWSIWSASPNWARAAALSPPPTTVKALVVAIASATVRVPAAKRGSSNTPMGPFHRTVRASVMASVNSAAVPGPMSRPIHPSGTSAPIWRVSPLRSGPEPNDPPGLSTVRSDGILMSRPDSIRRRQVSTWSASNSDAPTE